MRMPRVRFREFLLLTTLASLVAATFALWAKVGYKESAMEHARQARVASVDAEWCKDYVKWSKERMGRMVTAADKTAWQAMIKQAEVRLSKAEAEAEFHDRLARQLARY
jgi:hypothetical protein